MTRILELSRIAAVWLKATSRRGVSAIEYSLLAALIALVSIAAVMTLGRNLSNVFWGVSKAI